MPRKEKENISTLFAGLREAVRGTGAAISTRTIPSILEFVDSPDYLGLPLSPTNPIKLFPMQKLVLKAFYRGSEGNEHLEFDALEMEYLRECGLDKLMPDYSERGDVVGKILNGNVFRELVLVWGRRSGKDFIVSIIALYEAMKLLETPGGDPYAKYGLPRGGNPITILTVATAAPQAAIAFNEMKSKLMQSKYFRDKFIPEGLGAQGIYLLTPQDRIDNEDRLRRGMKPEKGGVLIRAGHSNSDSMLGIQCFVLLMDEVASFKQTEGSSGGHRIYEAMLPSLNTFVRDIPTLDEFGDPTFDPDGKQKMEKVFDSKIISISSPRGKEGILYEMFASADAQPDRLVCRLPTWIVNIKYDKASLRKTFNQFNDESFMMEFGAEFSATAGLNFFVEDRVRACLSHTMNYRKSGMPGVIYYGHLDPATSNNNYALAIVHKELVVNKDTHKASYIVVLDHLKVWSPRYDDTTKRINPVMIDEVEKYLLQINRCFHIGLMTYDMFSVMSSIQMLKKIGMPCKLTHYSKAYKMEVYTELEKLINEKRIIMPFNGSDEAELMLNEFLNLQRRYDSGRGFSVLPNKEAECHTDDCCDAISGAVYNCLESTHSKLPTARLASMPMLGSGAMRQWQSMSGMSMYGSGAQVANTISNRDTRTPWGPR